MKRYSKSFCFALSLALSSIAVGAEKIKVVASFSILGDITQQLGGDKIELTTLVGANKDSHVYKPTPFDAQKLALADLLVMNGLSFEGWISKLEQASGFKGIRVVASNGADIIDLNSEPHEEHEEHANEEQSKDDEHHHGDQDPHAWHSLTNIKMYVSNISQALMKIDPANRNYYIANQQRYMAQVNTLQKRLEIKVNTLPSDARQVITSHDAFGYIGRDYGFSFYAPVGLSTHAQPSAADVAKLIKQVREHNIKALFVENVSDDRLIKQIGRESKAKMGGKLYSDALSSHQEPADTYLKMMEHNINTLVNALN
jgi:zinc/manganese transport system substrate-binding protein